MAASRTLITGQQDQTDCAGGPGDPRGQPESTLRTTVTTEIVHRTARRIDDWKDDDHDRERWRAATQPKTRRFLGLPGSSSSNFRFRSVRWMSSTCWVNCSLVT